jgi:hypothetical protein
VDDTVTDEPIVEVIGPRRTRTASTITAPMSATAATVAGDTVADAVIAGTPIDADATTVTGVASVAAPTVGAPMTATAMTVAGVTVASAL